jgi:translocation and assembly module TamB
VRLDADWRLLLLQADAGRATLAGGVPLRWSEVRYRARERGAEFTLQAEAGPAQVLPFLQRLQPGIAWSGDLRMNAVADIRAGERFDAEIRLERQSGDLQVTESGTTQALGLSEVSLAFSAHDGLWRLTPLLVGRAVGTLTGSINVRTGAERRWPDSQAPVEGALHVSVPDIAIWSGWVPPGWRLQGDVSATALVDGRFGAPAYTGELRAEGVSVRNLLQGVALTEGRMLVALKGETARVEHFSVRGGEGTLTAEGEATFGERPAVSLRAQAQRFRVLGRVDRLVVASGDATLQVAPDRLRLDGSIKVDNGLFDLGAKDAPTLDDDVSLLRDGAPTGAAPGAVPARGRGNVAVALDIDLGDALRLRGRGLDALLKGRLRVTTPGGRLAVEGNVRAVDGTYAAYGQKLEIERGVVSFRGPVDSPELDILALRPNTDIIVGVTITGTTLNPRIRLYSDPELSDSEKLSWLMLGRGSEGLGRNDAALLQSAAMALVAGEGEDPTGKLLGSFGLDQFSVSQTDDTARETVVSVGKQLSRRWYVGYERSVNATAGTWQLIYRLGQRFTLRAQSGEDNSLDLIWTWRFNTVSEKVPGAPSPWENRRTPP